MDKVKIYVAVRPYYHDVIATIERKPRYNAKNETHYVSYKKKKFTLDKRSDGYFIWVDEE